MTTKVTLIISEDGESWSLPHPSTQPLTFQLSHFSKHILWFYIQPLKWLNIIMNAGHLPIETTRIRFPDENHTMLQLISACVRAPANEWTEMTEIQEERAEVLREKESRTTKSHINIQSMFLSSGPQRAKKRRKVEQQNSHINKYPEYVSPCKEISGIEHFTFLLSAPELYLLMSFSVGKKWRG